MATHGMTNREIVCVAVNALVLIGVSLGFIVMSVLVFGPRHVVFVNEHDLYIHGYHYWIWRDGQPVEIWK
jgi:hypothetical protein